MQFRFCSSSTILILKSILLNDLENKDIFPLEWEPNSDTDITFDSFTVSRTFTHQPRVDPPSALYWLEEMAWSLSPTLSKFQPWPDRADQFICLSKSKYVKNNHFQIEALRWFAAIANEYPTMSGAFTQLFNYHNKIKYSNSSILWKYHLPQRKNTKNVNSLGQLFMVIAMLCFPCLTKIQISVHSINPNTCDSKELFQLKNVSTTSSKIVNVTFYLEYIFYTEKKRYTTDCPVPLSDLHHFGGGSDRISKFYYHPGLCIQQTLSGTSSSGSKVVTQAGCCRCCARPWLITLGGNILFCFSQVTD